MLNHLFPRVNKQRQQARSHLKSHQHNKWHSKILNNHPKLNWKQLLKRLNLKQKQNLHQLFNSSIKNLDPKFFKASNLHLILRDIIRILVSSNLEILIMDKVDSNQIIINLISILPFSNPNTNNNSIHPRIYINKLLVLFNNNIRWVNSNQILLPYSRHKINHKSWICKVQNLNLVPNSHQR
jgi:hypothetical protein